jgi:lipoprotein-anchoring transpeptidase ErfK/SrfK
MRIGNWWIAATALPLLSACEFTVKEANSNQGQASAEANSAAPATQAGQQQQQAQVDPSLQNLRFQVDISDRKLTLLNGPQKIGEHPVAVGTKKWPTPTGNWNIHQVDLNPEWIPPKDEEWAKDEKTAAPGSPENPLGRVRLVYRMPNTIHGTYDTASLGKASSHGSIRVANEVGLQLAQMLLKAGGSWQGDPWFQQMLQNKGKEFPIKLAKPIPIVVQE